MQSKLPMHRKLVAQDPDSADAGRDVSVTLNKIGEVKLRNGDNAGALAIYQEGVQTFPRFCPVR